MQQRVSKRNNILLVNITRLGDMLQATPTIAGMKAENPNCKVTVLVEKQFESVCHWLPNIDEVLTIDLGMTVRSLARGNDGIIDAYEYVDEFVEDLKKKNFDYCLNMSSSGYTALLLKLLNVPEHGGWTADEEGNRVIQSEWAKLFATSVFHQNRQFNSLNLVDVFRSSANVRQHPKKLLINLDEEAKAHCEKLIQEMGYTNTGPLICVQAGASQGKRQWEPQQFVRMIKLLVEKYNARVALTGTSKEMNIIEPICAGCNSPNVGVFAGKTNIPQLAALLSMSDILITGDTGTMHVSVAAGTPVIAMFLASAYGFETGPYSEGNIVLQPIIGCGPCNPNKACARTDCHDHIEPELMAELAVMRIKEDFKVLPPGLVDPSKVIVYRSYFDEHGFCGLAPLTPTMSDPLKPFRDAYRKLWLDDLSNLKDGTPAPAHAKSLSIAREPILGLNEVIQCAQHGVQLIDELIGLIKDQTAPPKELSRVSGALGELDRLIEETGFHFAPVGPVTRMFVFAKENISGSDPLSLASQTRDNYLNLERRCRKFENYYAGAL